MRAGIAGGTERSPGAAVLAVVVHNPGTVEKTFEVTAGNVPIEEAVAAIAVLPAASSRP